MRCLRRYVLRKLLLRLPEVSGGVSGRSARVAAGGVFSALCLTLMFLTGLIPFVTYAMPAMAGAMLVAVVVENGRKTALLVYISVSALSVFIVPDREAAMLFIAFFGYYAIIKGPIERLHRPVWRNLTKLALFNAAIVGGFLAASHLFGMGELVSDENSPFKHFLLFMLAGGNLFFLMYDRLLTKYTEYYLNRFRPKFLRR